MADPIFRTDPIIPPPPETRRGYWFHMRHRGLRHRVLFLAYASSLTLTALIPLAVLIPSLLYPWTHVISFVFITIQIAEKCAENHLRNREAFSDFGFSLLPALVGLLAVPILWHRVLPGETWSMIWEWTAYAWLDVIGGYAIHNTVLNAPYAREEEPADH